MDESGIVIALWIVSLRKIGKMRDNFSHWFVRFNSPSIIRAPSLHCMWVLSGMHIMTTTLLIYLPYVASLSFRRNVKSAIDCVCSWTTNDVRSKMWANECTHNNQHSFRSRKSGLANIKIESDWKSTLSLSTEFHQRPFLTAWKFLRKTLSFLFQHDIREQMNRTNTLVIYRSI